MATDKAVTKRRRSGLMSDEHKAALAEGREQSQVIRRYLEAILAQPSRRNRRHTTEAVEARLAEIEAEISAASTIVRLQLLQERLDLREELANAGSSEHMQELEDAFVANARSYGERKGISYAAWREIGVSAAVLKRASIHTRQAADLG